MTNRQRIFIAEYLNTLDVTRSAIKAGYSRRSAYSTGSRLLKNAEIQKYVGEVMNERINSRIADRSERQEFLTTIMRDNEQPTKERLRACELLCRLDGDFINRSSVEVKTENTLSELILKEYKSNEGQD